eukprot:3436699-Alexandrium_andersonii.AAC.1
MSIAFGRVRRAFGALSGALGQFRGFARNCPTAPTGARNRTVQFRGVSKVHNATLDVSRWASGPLRLGQPDWGNHTLVEPYCQSQLVGP